MKAVVVDEFGPVESARIKDVAWPEPGPGEVLLEIRLVPANFVDTLVIRGEYQFLPQRPFTPGKGPVGVVASVGRDVTRFSPGDRVLAMAEQGGYAEAISVSQDQCYRLPDSMGFEDATTISLAYDTAWFALHDRARLASGDTVLVLGSTGAVGLAAIQLAKAAGARVIAGVASPSKTGLVRDAGADETVDLARPDLRDSLRTQIYALTDGRGADVVIDPLGDIYFEAALRAMAWRGRLVVVGFAAGRIPTVQVNYLLVKNIEISGLQISDYRKRRPELVRDCFERIFELHAMGRIRPLPVRVYPLEDFALALDDVVNRRLSGRAALDPRPR